MKRLRLLVLLPLVALACGGKSKPAGPPATIPIPGHGPDHPVLSFRVVDTADRPVSGVKVHIRLPFGAGEPGLAGLETTTGDDGEAVFDVEKELSPSRDAPVYVTFERAGYVAHQTTIPGFRPGVGQRVTVTMPVAGRVEGRVLDGRGRPVADAFVYLVLPRVSGFVHEDEVVGGKSGPDGTYRIEDAPPGDFDLGVRAPGFVPALVKDVRVVGRETLHPPDFVLVPGGSISGSVQTPEGEPVAGARVRAWRDRKLADFSWYGRSGIDSAGGVATTGADGGFRIDGLAEAGYHVDAARYGYSAANAEVAGATPGTTDLLLTLAAGRVIRIHVVDRATGKPVVRFRLQSAEKEGDSDLQGRPLMKDDRQVTSPVGTTELRFRAGAHYRLEVAAGGYAIAAREIGPVDSDTPGDLTIRLARRE